MFNSQFFPTPIPIIQKMLRAADHHKWTGSDVILEPSAGKGDILDYIASGQSHRLAYQKFKVYAIEVEPELQAILREKGHSIIANDFLQDEILHRPTVIIMNPPFDEGAKHGLRAWQILKPGGTIVCLLNSETLNNPHTKERQLLLEILEQHGAKIEDLGKCFATAERKTNVNVSMFTLTKPGTNYDFFNMPNFDKATEKETMDFDINDMSSSVEIQDALLSREHRYRASIDAFKEMAAAIKNFYNTVSPLVDFQLTSERANFLEYAGQMDFNGFLDSLNAMAWAKLLKETKFERYMTTDVQNKFRDMFSHQKKFAFTKKNMQIMFDSLMQNAGNILDQNLLGVFDTFTKYHKENRCHIEGWKTNDAFKVNRKVILPNYVRYGEYMNSHSLSSSGDRFKCYQYTELNDIDRALCYITGKKFELAYGEVEDAQNAPISRIYHALENKFKALGYVKTNEKFDNTCESTFFNITFFKKGTIHLYFKDELVWQIFNMKVAQMRGYPLPAGEADDIKKREQERRTQTGLLMLK